MADPMSEATHSFRELRLETILRESFSDKLKTVELDEDSTVYSSNQPVNHFYYLLEGLLGLYRHLDHGKRILVQTISSDITVGVTQLYSGDCYPADLKPLTRTKALVGNSNHLNFLEKKNPEIIKKIIQKESIHHGRAFNKFDSVNAGTVKQRITRNLLELAEHLGSDTPDGIRIELKLTRSDLSQIVGCCQETVSRIMSKLESENLIKTQQKTITLKEPGELRRELESLQLA